MSPSAPFSFRPDLLLIADSTGRILSASEASRERLGRPPEGLTLAELFGESAAHRLQSEPEAQVALPPLAPEAGGPRGEWHLQRLRLADGGLLVYATAPRVGPGEVPAAWERRITRKLLNPTQEDLIGQQRAFMLAIFDADPNLIFVKDCFGRFIFVNKAVGDLFFSTPDEIVLQHNAEVHRNEEELKTFDAVDQRVLTTGQEVCVEESFTKADGVTVWYDTRKRPLLAPNGETFVLGISVEITERRNMEQLLEDARQRLELAVSAGQLGLWDWNVGESRVYFSPTWKAQLGYEDEELPNTFETWMSRMHPEDVERVMGVVQQHMKDATHGDRYMNEFRMRAKDGSWRWIAGYGLVVRDKSGAGVRVTGYHVDITERKRREEEEHALRESLRRTNRHLERLGRMKDEFLANMSHELRTPLNAILGQAEALAEGIFGSLTEGQRAALQTVEESGQHLLSLINDVLDIAKSNSGYLELELEEVAVEEVCQESLRLVREQARRKGLTVGYSSDGTVERLTADRRRLRQILLNLLSNAKKFTPEKGRIGLEVTAREEGQAVAFTVWDTGCGIAGEELQRVFEPFVQLDAGLARRSEGSGLGLSLVRRFAELHGGKVEVESEVGRGSRFTVVLPVQQPKTPAVPRLEDRAASSGSSPTAISTTMARTVLVADDHEANTRHLQDYLETHGYTVRVARDGYEAVRLCHELKPTVVLMDIQMPGLDGLEAIKQIRASPTTASVPIVALTALAMQGDRERCMAAGANDYLSKPVRLRHVLEVVVGLEARVRGVA
jgi:PAS domain S-box-containing protein